MIATILMTSLATLFIFSSLLLPHTKATDVEISSISPATYRGKVGEEVRIIGTINTTDGWYHIWFDHSLNKSARAIGNKVNATFRVPKLPGGNHTITLHDEETKNNATTWFYIETGYYIVPDLPKEPKLLQQDDTVNLNLTVTGGKRNTVYCANVTVELPYPLNATTYSAIVELSNTTNTGCGNATVAYPNETLFHPSGPHINYTGSYLVYFNKTQDLAENSFFIGFTDFREYHREEIVEIRAIGYQANETASITIISLETNNTLLSLAVNASQQGVINATWPVPSNASIGDYNVTITSEKKKEIPDSQIIRVPGYPIKVYTRNLAGDTVPQILVEALDRATNKTYSNTTETDGLAHLSLEKGNHTLEAFWKEVKVNETQVTVTGNRTYNLMCGLTNVKITVKDKDENRMPFVHLNVAYQFNTTKENREKNGSETGETSISGVFYLNSTLPHITYSINASRYGRVFNRENKTVENLPAKKWFNVTILCPAKTLTLNITEHHRHPLPNARIELIEQMGGISYNVASNHFGVATENCTFGKYEVKVYKGNLCLNSTLIDLFNDTDIGIYCKIYNLTLSVRIVDYFGQLIPSANVTLQREGSQYLSPTKSNGILEFANVTGGDLQITVYLYGESQPCVTKSFFVDMPKTIEIKIGKYVMLVGFLVETSQLTTALMIIAALILILLVEVYRRRAKSQRS